MLEKLKAAYEAIKGFILWILAPLLFIAATIYYLFSENEDLRGKLAQKGADEKTNQILEQAKEADKHATDEQEDYEAVRARYLAEHPDDKPSSN